MAADDSNNLNVADGRNHPAFRIDSEGAIDLIAGAAVPGHARNGGPAVAAGLSVCGVAVSESGDIWFPNPANRCILVLRLSKSSATVQR